MNIFAKSFLIMGVLVAMGIFIAYPSRAQTPEPQIILTWKTETLTPHSFLGKTLPTSNSVVQASLAVVDGGAAQDISEETIYWYVDDRLIENKPGTTHASFAIPFVGQQGTISLRVELPNYKNQSLIKTVAIPIVIPEAVIEAPFFNNEFSWSPITLFARGYFFNARSFSELLPSWLINGSTPESSGDPESLTLNIDPSLPSGTRITVGLTIDGKGGVIGSASSQKTITLYQ